MLSVTIVGNVGADVIVTKVDSLPPPGGDLIVDHITMRPAGAAGNTALALANLGDQCTLVSLIGDDDFGRYVSRALREHDLHTAVSVVPGSPTGVSICIEGDQRERSFWTTHGALDLFDEAAVPSGANEADLFLLTGYFTLPAMRGSGARRLLQRARSAGATTLLDTGWDPDDWTGTGRDEVLSLLEISDVFLPNEHEARALAAVGGVTEAAARLQSISGGWVIVKRGADGAYAHGPDGQVLAVSAPSVAPHDTTGAGDSLNAGVLHSLAHGRSWSEAVRFGVRLASTVVSRTSAIRYPSLAELGEADGP